jgi:hypothetical protein
MFLGFEGTKGLILKIINEKPGLSVKEIYYRIKKESPKKLSYQAIHKIIVLLLNQGVIKKDGLKYYIDSTWVKSIKISADILDANCKCIQKNDFSELKYNDCAVFSFGNILDLAYFLVNIFLKLPNPSKKPNINLWELSYSIIGLDSEIYSELKKCFLEVDTYVFVSENNILDKVFAKALEKYGVKKISFGINGASLLQDIMVSGDFVAHIWFDSKFRALWYLQNRGPKKATDIDLTSHINLMRSLNYFVKVIVVKDSILADQIRETYINNVNNLPLKNNNQLTKAKFQ